MSARKRILLTDSKKPRFLRPVIFSLSNEPLYLETPVPGLESYITRDLAEAVKFVVANDLRFDLFADGLGSYMCAERHSRIANQMHTFWPIASALEIAQCYFQQGESSATVALQLLPCVPALILDAQRYRASSAEQLDLFAL